MLWETLQSLEVFCQMGNNFLQISREYPTPRMILSSLGFKVGFAHLMSKIIYERSVQVSGVKDVPVVENPAWCSKKH